MTDHDDDSEDRTRKLIAENIRRVEELLRFLPLPDGTVNDLRQKIAMLRTILLEQRPPAFVLVGRRGAGKSSLINAIFGKKVAEVGHVKAQTGRGRWFDHASELGSMSILDTRGMQEGSAPEESDTSKDALSSILVELRKKAPDVVLFLVKASEVDSAIDTDLDALERIFAEVERHHRYRPPLVAVATHCDVLEPKDARLHVDGANADDLAEKLGRVAEVEHHLDTKIKARHKLGPHLVWVRGVSTYLSFKADGGAVRSDERWRVEELVGTLFKHIPDAGRGTFVRIARVRGLQEELANNLTRAVAALCAGIAALPIPVADVIPITSLQVTLVAAIAWLSGRSLDRKSATEFVSAMGINVGAAFALREGFRAIAKVVAPGLGSMVSGVIAFAGTLAIGAAARSYFLHGATIEEAKRAYEEEKTAQEPEAQRHVDGMTNGASPPGASSNETPGREHQA